MKKNIILCIVFLMMATVSGCSKKDTTEIDYSYVGENDLWDAEYHVTGTEEFTETGENLKYSNEMNNILAVKYKGELQDLSSVKYLKISYESQAHKGSMEIEYSEGDRITSKTFNLISSGTNTAIVGENEIIKVTIDIDGEIQNIELKRN